MEEHTLIGAKYFLLIKDFKAWPLALSFSIKNLGPPTVLITGKKQPGLILACVIGGERNYRRGSLPKKWAACQAATCLISYYTVHTLYINIEYQHSTQSLNCPQVSILFQTFHHFHSDKLNQ